MGGEREVKFSDTDLGVMLSDKNLGTTGSSADGWYWAYSSAHKGLVPANHVSVSQCLRAKNRCRLDRERLAANTREVGCKYQCAMLPCKYAAICVENCVLFADRRALSPASSHVVTLLQVQVITDQTTLPQRVHHPQQERFQHPSHPPQEHGRLLPSTGAVHVSSFLSAFLRS